LVTIEDEIFFNDDDDDDDDEAEDEDEDATVPVPAFPVVVTDADVSKARGCDISCRIACNIEGLCIADAVDF